ncbi:MAG: glucose-1-phosphate adenylyltransferase subunit GlgD [Oscillospiraceae bacterium]|nr:glucose-1-phosphate adenylyltransferase subunit GlgD [Oscillospiraceae bacterium]
MMQQNKKILGIIFANMHDTRISELTKVRTMGSVPFGGKYRLIDFPLSCMVNSGIYQVGLITKSNYQSLMNHLGSGREWDLSRKKDGLYILPPFGHSNHGLYRGKIEALGGARSFIAASDAKYILFSDCNTVANLDYRPFIDAHMSSGADVTLMYTKRHVDNDVSEGCSVIDIDGSGRVTGVMCEAKLNGEFNISSEIAIVGREFILKIIDEFHSKGLYSFDRDFLQNRCGEYNIRTYRYNGLMMQINSMRQYYETNMSLLDYGIRNELFPRERSIYAKVRDEAPAKYGLGASVKNSMITDGCIIDGHVEDSILFRGVKIEKGAVVKNSIIMQNTAVRDSTLAYVIADKNVVITAGHPMLGSENYPIFITKGSVI